jgi:Cu+-exporting ATPase
MNLKINRKIIVLTIAFITAVYWKFNDAARIWPAVTAIFIIACPCALLLSNTFTNGNILRILGRNHFYLRSAQTIEDMAKATHIVFDKTGTLTTTQQQDITHKGPMLTAYQKQQVAALATCSSHPLSKALARHLEDDKRIEVKRYKESPGMGIMGVVNGDVLKLGSYSFVNGCRNHQQGTAVFVCLNDKLFGHFEFCNHYRDNIIPLLNDLKKYYRLSVLSGDNDAEKETGR